jgi:DNA-binding response OmpR family regulator
MPETLAAPGTTLPDVLIVDAQAENYAPLFAESFRIVAASRAAAAFESMTRVIPAALVVDLGGQDGAALDVIRRARSFSMPPAILATTTNVEQAPDALLAGCDSILLKPFPPNLLASRLSRLIRMRMQSLRQQSVLLREQASRSFAKSMHPHERGTLLSAGCTKHWVSTHCPHCNHEGVTSFEYASHRRAWYACLSCKKVWMAKRRD